MAWWTAWTQDTLCMDSLECFCVKLSEIYTHTQTQCAFAIDIQSWNQSYIRVLCASKRASAFHQTDNFRTNNFIYVNMYFCYSACVSSSLTFLSFCLCWTLAIHCIFNRNVSHCFLHCFRLELKRNLCVFFSRVCPLKIS